jgi:virginiamycin B lyase
LAPTADSQPYGIALVPDGRTIWFTERAGNRLGRYTYITQIVEFPLPTPASSPTGIAIDSAGCAWYTAPAANQIGRFCSITSFLPLVVKNR